MEGSFADSGPASLSAARILYRDRRGQVQTVAFYRSSFGVRYSLCPVSPDRSRGSRCAFACGLLCGAAASCSAQEHEGKALSSSERAADSAASPDVRLVLALAAR